MKIYPESTKQSAIVMYVRGYSLRDVADKHGTSHQTVRNWLVKCGITMRRKSKPVVKIAKTKTRSERFWEKVKKGSQCWEWTAAKSGAGYGVFWNGKRQIYAHRYSWELHNNKIVPGGLVIMHTCDNPRCVRPGHLVLGTYADNTMDSIRKGRRPYNGDVPK